MIPYTLATTSHTITIFICFKKMLAFFQLLYCGFQLFLQLAHLKCLHSNLLTLNSSTGNTKTELLKNQADWNSILKLRVYSSIEIGHHH